MKMKRMLTTSLVVLLLSSTLCVVAQKQQPRNNDATKTPPTAEQIAQKKTDRMSQQLGLSEDQAQKIYAINLNAAKRSQELRTQQQALRNQQQANCQAITQQVLSLLNDEQQASYVMMCRQGKAGKRDGVQGQGTPRQGAKGVKGGQGRGAKGGKRCPAGTPETCPLVAPQQ